MSSCIIISAFLNTQQPMNQKRHIYSFSHHIIQKLQKKLISRSSYPHHPVPFYSKKPRILFVLLLLSLLMFLRRCRRHHRHSSRCQYLSFLQVLASPFQTFSFSNFHPLPYLFPIFQLAFPSAYLTTTQNCVSLNPLSLKFYSNFSYFSPLSSLYAALFLLQIKKPLILSLLLLSYLPFSLFQKFVAISLHIYLSTYFQTFFPNSPSPLSPFPHTHTQYSPIFFDFHSFQLSFPLSFRHLFLSYIILSTLCMSMGCRCQTRHDHNHHSSSYHSHHHHHHSPQQQRWLL